MNKVNDVLLKYGLSTNDKFSQESLKRKLISKYKRLEIKYPRTNEEMKKHVFETYTAGFYNILIVDKEIFSQWASKYNVEIPFPHWYLDLISVSTYSTRKTSYLLFKYRNHFTKKLLQERMETDKADMKKEFPASYLKNLFESTYMVDDIKKTVRKKVNKFVTVFNETKLAKVIIEELEQAMWLEYQEAKRSVLLGSE